jgi:hypothetical protein
MSWNIAQAKQQFSEVVPPAVKKTLGEEFAELRQIAAEENYELPRPEVGRPNAFAGCGIPVLNPFSI